MTNEHTPTPWRVHISGGIVTAREYEYVPIFQAANESFIVRAVNAHDDLVAALRELQQCDGSPDNVASAEILASRVREFASSALLKAEASR